MANILDFVPSDGSMQEATLEKLDTIIVNTGGTGAAGFRTVTPLADGITFDSGLIDMTDSTQVQTEVLASHSGILTFSFYEDAAGVDNVRTLSFPYDAALGFQFFSAPTFGYYVRYQFENNSGSAQTDFYFTTKLSNTALSAQVISLTGNLATGMTANVGRSVLVGQDLNGAFSNVSTTLTNNDSGTTTNLNVVSGARPSQLAGRVKVSEVLDTAVSVLQRTITADKTFYVTDIVLTIDNIDNAATGRVTLRDGLTVAGTVILPMLVQESPTNESAVQVVQHSFTEPIEFSTGLFVEESTGINTITGVIIGYEE